MTNGFVRAALFGTLAVIATTSIAEASYAHIDPTTIINGNAETIRELYISSSRRDSWEDDELGQWVLDPGYQIEWYREGGHCDYDIKMVFSSGREETLWNVDLCDVTVFTL
jgi:hypothetical protein